MTVNLKHQISFITWRFYFVLAIILLAVIGLIWRILDLSIFDQRFLKEQGDERVLRLVSTPAFRGMIVDRNGFPLAVSTTVYSIWMNPKEFTPTNKDILALSKLLNIKPKEITTIYNNSYKKKREFVYLQRAMSPQVANDVKALNISGIYSQQEYKRYYPEGETTAHVVGFTNVDDQGQEGLELSYNQWLAGEPGKKWVVKDRLGRVISDVQTIQDEKPGHDLVLSIDRRIQYLAYRELLAGVTQTSASSGSVVVLDIKTGEVLAMVNQPAFNPNNRANKMTESFRNRAVTDTFEPGSTIKAFTVASALEAGRIRPDSVIDTTPGWMRIGRNVVKDKRDNGPLSVSQILQISSNMGAAKIVLSSPPDQLWSLLHRVGFGESTGIEYPGEQNGVLVRHSPWGGFTLATLSFGYGMSANTLQLARAYAVLGGNGIKRPMTLLHSDHEAPGEQVLDPKVAREMLTLMESVVMKGGTAEAARIQGYRVAGKTGTTKQVGANGYESNHYNSSFVGIAPLSDPRLVIAVVIHDPKGKKHQGGDVSAPVFAKIMEGTLRILDVPPDAAQTL